MKIVYLGQELTFKINESSYESRQWETDVINEVILDDFYGVNILRKKYPTIKRILDLGAHIGSFSVMAQVAWPNAEITSVEPKIDNFRRLIENRKEVGRFVNGTVSYSGDHESMIACQPLNSGGNILIKNTIGFENYQIEKTRNYTIEELGDFELIKMDIEGSEYDVLENMVITDNLKVIVGEYHTAAKEYPPKWLELIVKNRFGGFLVEYRPHKAGIETGLGFFKIERLG